ncbi:hypothetical protein RSAG8_04184, partial [Rhizoctonia solani AG-8 WAC10335]
MSAWRGGDCCEAGLWFMVYGLYMWPVSVGLALPQRRLIGIAGHEGPLIIYTLKGASGGSISLNVKAK